MGRHAAATDRRAGTASRRLRAILAGGLVLGVGTAVTLAAWTDQEVGAGSFTASVFNTESSVDRAAWAHNTNPPVATFAAVGGLSPGVVAYTPFNIRLTSATNVNGTLVLGGASRTETPGSLTEVLQYRITRLASPTTTCDAANSGSNWVVGGTELWVDGGAVAATSPTSLTTSAREVRLCIAVRIKPDAPSTYQGATGTLTWIFTSTSDS